MNYLALTIGPIHETMKYCQKTRELWVGSYFFSYFMKTMIKNILFDNKIKMIIPYVDDEKEFLDLYYEEGVFHDRFIATSDDTKESINIKLEQAITDTIKNVIKDLKMDKNAEETLKNYLQYSYIVATEEELLAETGRTNPVFAIDAILDSMELQNSFDFKNSTKHYDIEVPDLKHDRGPYTALAKLQYEAKDMKNILDTELSFKSIPEIAIANLLEQKIDNIEVIKKLNETIGVEDKIDKYDEFYKVLSDTHFKAFKPHHKYYAVIYADGDKMGSSIRKIYSEEDRDEKIKQFSKNIYHYIRGNQEAKRDEDKKSLSKIFDDFGGMVIFAGGDDLLAFAPIFGKNGKTIFSLLDEVSTKFKYTMQKDLTLANDVTLSLGVNINYYKSPMIEAIDRAYDLLMKAKNNNNEQDSGSVSLSLTKHSGQSFDATFFLGDESYKKYQELFTLELNTEEASALPHNIQYSLKNAEYLICDIYKNNSKEIADARIDALFENSIKDGSHTSAAQSALDVLKAYIKELQPKDKSDFEKLISQLAIIKFLRGDQ